MKPSQNQGLSWDKKKITAAAEPSFFSATFEGFIQHKVSKNKIFLSVLLSIFWRI
jgi:hypothetical protein